MQDVVLVVAHVRDAAPVVDDLALVARLRRPLPDVGDEVLAAGNLKLDLGDDLVVEDVDLALRLRRRRDAEKLDLRQPVAFLARRQRPAEERRELAHSPAGW